MLLFAYRALEVPLTQNNNTEAHAVCTYTRITCIKIHTMGVSCRIVLELYEFTRFDMPKQSA
jgi:hypothetical protein